MQGTDFAVGCARSVIRQKPWSICSRTSRVSGKPIECREMRKHEPGMVEDNSHMAIPRLVETRLRSKLLSEGTSTFGWSQKTSKNPTLHADRGSDSGSSAILMTLVGKTAWDAHIPGPPR